MTFATTPTTPLWAWSSSPACSTAPTRKRAWARCLAMGARGRGSSSSHAAPASRWWACPRPRASQSRRSSSAPTPSRSTSGATSSSCGPTSRRAVRATSPRLAQRRRFRPPLARVRDARACCSTPPHLRTRTLQQDHQVARFTATQREWFKGDSGVCITTYTMVAFTGRRSEESERIMQDIMGREWGVILLDEVHVVPAQVRALGGACCSRGAGWVVGCVLHCTRVRALVLATHAPSHVVARPPARPPTRSPSRARCSAACWASSRRTASWG